MKSAIVPTARALVMLAVLAPLAVLSGAILPALWPVAPLVGLALIGAVVIDGRLAGTLHDLKLTAPQEIEVGQPAAVHVHAELRGHAGRAPPPQAVLGFDPRLGPDGTLAIGMAAQAIDDIWAGSGQLVPTRRGVATIDQLWLRWRGPLGLAWRQTKQPMDQLVRVRPDLSPIRSPVLQTVLRDANFGLTARRVRGAGSQFGAMSEFQPGMDRRRIDWKTSARHTRLYARENEAERDNQIVFAFDCGQAMCEPVDGLPRIDRAVSAALTAGYVALKGGDRVALFGFAQRPHVMTPFAADPRDFHRLQSAAAALDYTAAEPNYTLALATLTARLRRRSLIVLFSEFTDPTSAELMLESIERLLRHHLLIFVTLHDTELADLAAARPASVAALASAVAADSLARQRHLVLQRLRRLGVDVIEAPWQQIGYRLIDRYLATKRAEAIG